MLLLLSGFITSSTLLALRPSETAVFALLGVSVVLVSFVIVSAWLPWARLPSRTTLAFPLAVMAGLVAIALADHTTAIAYTGLIVFAFAYVGLTQPPGTSSLLVPAAAGCWVEVQGSWSAELGVRLIIAMSVWITIGELLGRNAERQRQLTSTLRGSANTDPLTGLLNRRGLREALKVATAADTVVLCDIDFFKAINDKYGHDEGDQVLAAFGALLEHSLRGDDVAARYGGEEFLLLLVGATPAAAVEVLARMRSRWGQTHPTVTFSAGIATVTSPDTVPHAITDADAALYRAKQAGRNCDRTAQGDLREEPKRLRQPSPG